MAMTDALPDDPGTLKAMVLAECAHAERLEQIIKEMQRHRFGRRAEALPEDQLLLGLEEGSNAVTGFLPFLGLTAKERFKCFKQVEGLFAFGHY